MEILLWTPPEQLKGAICNLAKKKGRLLISAILGIAERATMDMVTTIKDLPMDEQSIRKAIREILGQTLDDGIEFQLLDLIPIR